MRILFDQGVPRGLTASRRNHEVTEGRKLNRERISNGELIAPAEGAGFHLLLNRRGGLFRRHLDAVAGPLMRPFPAVLQRSRSDISSDLR
jgi:hypothetical protein